MNQLTNATLQVIPSLGEKQRLWCSGFRRDEAHHGEGTNDEV